MIKVIVKLSKFCVILISESTGSFTYCNALIMDNQVPFPNTCNVLYNTKDARKKRRTINIALSGAFLLFLLITYISCKKTNADVNQKQVNTTITSVKPVSAKPGDTVIIIGTNFYLNPALDTVKFNGIPAQVLKAKADTLFVIVPKGNTTGVVTINGISAAGPVFTLLQIHVTSVIPGFGKHGDTIIVTGSNFYLNSTEDTVMIHGANAHVIKASADTLYVIVPITSTGAITVNGVTAPAPDFIYEPTVLVTTLVGPGSANNTNDNIDGPDSLATIFPVGLCFDKQGNLFVSNGADCIREISGGFVSTVSCINTTGLPPYSGIAIDAQNNLYVTDGNSTKVKIIRNGVISDFTNVVGFQGELNGPLATATFYHPGALTNDSLGNLYVGEPGDIRKISPDGIVSTFAGKLATVDSTSFPGNPFPIILPNIGYQNGQDTVARFGYIGSLATDAQGNVYAADAECQCVRKITPSGLVSTLGFVGHYYRQDNYNGLWGMCADATGNIYVSVKGAIFKITPLGASSVLAGNEIDFPNDTIENYGFGFADGPAAIALFNYPTGLACDAQGNVYVADTGNKRIRKISFQ
jgi:serine/threonine-protein kinase